MTTRTMLVAIDAGTPDVSGAEHLVHLLDRVLPVRAASYVASTHVVGAGGAHTAVAASWRDAGEEPVVWWCDRLAEQLLDAGIVASAGDQVAVAGPAHRWPGARAAAAEHRARGAGRVTRFAGQAAIERVTTVADVVALSSIDEVVALGAATCGPESLVDLREWVRPTWRAGRSVLTVQPARHGLVPFESRQQIACCADH